MGAGLRLGGGAIVDGRMEDSETKCLYYLALTTWILLLPCTGERHACRILSLGLVRAVVGR